MGELNSEQAIVATFQQLVSDRDALSTATIERQQEVAEHDLVIRTLEPLEGGRRCFRLVGDVLVERTVAEVLPAVQKNRENLTALVATYEKQLAAKQKDVLAFQEKYNIRIKGEGGEGSSGSGAAAGKAPGAGQGVLVGS